MPCPYVYLSPSASSARLSHKADPSFGGSAVKSPNRHEEFGKGFIVVLPSYY